MHSRTYNPKTGYFYDKTKIFMANLQVSDYLRLKLFQKAAHIASPHLGLVAYKCNPKMSGFKREL